MLYWSNVNKLKMQNKTKKQKFPLNPIQAGLFMALYFKFIKTKKQTQYQKSSYYGNCG